MAAAHGKSPAQVLLRWQIQAGIAVIPKSANPARIEENCNLRDLELTDEEMNSLNGLNCNKRYIESEPLKKHKHYPFK